MKKGKRITHDTREAGLQAILPYVGDIEEKVFEAVRIHHAGLTAEEVSEATGISLNNSRSRLTELTLDGRLIVIGKRLNKAETRRVAVWATPLRARPGASQ